MAPSKRKTTDSWTTRPKKKFKKQLEYHSSSEEDGDRPEDTPSSLPPQKDGASTHPKRDQKGKRFGQADQEADHRETDASERSDEENQDEDPSLEEEEEEEKGEEEEEEEEEEEKEEEEEEEEEKEEEEEGEDGESDNDDDDDGDDASDSSLETSKRTRHVPKRNDPGAFSTSISKILSTKLPTSARADPVLSRSKAAAQMTTDQTNEKLDKRARAQLRAEKKEELDRGRVRDVLGIERGQAGDTAEEEKRLRKVAQRGVVKLFNAVRAAQVRGEEAAREQRRKGTIGMEERKKAVNEVSKQSFLELINGKQGRDLKIEEA